MDQCKAGKQQVYKELLALIQDEYTRVCQRERYWKEAYYREPLNESCKEGYAFWHDRRMCLENIRLKMQEKGEEYVL